jgi:hypothetical protein
MEPVDPKSLPVIKTPQAAAPVIGDLAAFIGFATVVIEAGDTKVFTMPGNVVRIFNITPTSSVAAGSGFLDTQLLGLKVDARAEIPVYGTPFEITVRREFKTISLRNLSSTTQVIVRLYAGYADDLLIPGSDSDGITLAGMPMSGLVAAEITRAANTTAYAVGQSVMGSGNVAFTGLRAIMRRIAFNGAYVTGRCKITKARLEKNGATVANAAFRVALFSGSTAYTDAGAFTIPYGLTTWLGTLDFPVMSAEGGSGAYCELQNINVPLCLPSTGFAFAAGFVTDITAIMIAEAAYTPASAEKFTLSLWSDQF